MTHKQSTFVNMASWLQCVALSLFVIFDYVIGNAPHRKFEYKYSFKPPYLAQRDGSVPFWEYGGNAIASADSVRVAPSLKSQKGAIWTKSPTNFRWWEVNVVFRISGRGRIGADGLAFWFTKDKGQYDGTVFGSSDRWTGLGVFFDSFDNDNKHNNPYIMALINDGTKEFDHANDGSTQLVGGCLRDFRNKPFPTRARIEYYMNTLTILFHSGMTNNDEDMEVCLRKENVYLPEFGYFGISAATGGLADDHDVYHFLTTSLTSTGPELSAGRGVTSEEQQKLTQEYQEYQKKLDQQKEQYQLEHPESKKEPDEFDDWFETDNQRELRQIFTGQSHMFEVMKDLHKKLDEVIGRQERTLSLMSQQPISVAPGQMIDTIRRHEVDAVLQNQNIVVAAVNELRNIAIEMNTRVDRVLQNQARQPTAQVQSVGYDVNALMKEVRDGLSSVQHAVSGSAQLSARNNTCPSCLNVTTFLVFLAIQLILILGYFTYRERRTEQAKKFY